MHKQRQKALRIVLYSVLGILMIPTFYLIFNSGNPQSVLRPILPPPEYDFIVTLALGFVILVISFTLTSLNSVDPVRQILAANEQQIRRLRNNGKSDAEIADSFIRELKIHNPLSRCLVRRKTYRFLKEYR